MSHRPAHEALGLRFDRLPLSGRVALALAVAALWLLGRRYAGLTHDATLYVLTGLHRLDPAAFESELFFAHGSQDAYTLFSWLYAPLIHALGAGAAAMAVTIAGQVAVFAASALLLWRLVPGPSRWWSLALLAAASGYYGGVGVFRIAETFATARSLAEPLVVAALAMALAGRTRAAWLALIVAATIHPLVAAPGFAVMAVWQGTGRYRWNQMLVAAFFCAAALWISLALLGERFDAPWRAAVEDRSPHLFLSLWMAPDWARVIWGACVLGLALRVLDAGARRLALAVAAVGIGGILASGLAVDLFDSATAAGLQLWRSHWLVQFLALLLAPAAVAGLWRGGPAGRAAAACLAASCCFGRSELPAAAVLAVLSVLFDAAARRRAGSMGDGAARLAVAGAACAASVGILLEVQSRLPAVYGAERPAAWTDYVNAAGSVGGLLPLALLLWLLACSRLRALAVALAALALVLGVAAWDARAPWPRFVEEAGGAQNPFRDAVPAKSQVFWPAPHSPAWIVLGRPTWFSADQGAGIVFARETALTFAERKSAAQELMAADENCRYAAAGTCSIDAARARALCERRDGPDYLVLGSPIGAQASVDWPLAPGVLPGVRSLHLYSCRGLK